jgi:hypothetical protein
MLWSSATGNASTHPWGANLATFASMGLHRCSCGNPGMTQPVVAMPDDDDTFNPPARRNACYWRARPVFFANDVAVSGTTIAKKPRPARRHVSERSQSRPGGAWRAPGLLLVAVIDLGEGL